MREEDFEKEEEEEKEEKGDKPPVPVVAQDEYDTPQRTPNRKMQPAPSDDNKTPFVPTVGYKSPVAGNKNSGPTTPGRSHTQPGPTAVPDGPDMEKGVGGDDEDFVPC